VCSLPARQPDRVPPSLVVDSPLGGKYSPPAVKPLPLADTEPPEKSGVAPATDRPHNTDRIERLARAAIVPVDSLTFTTLENGS
jgi:hypothetical protein